MRFRDGKSSTIKHKARSVHVYIDGHRMRKSVLCPQDMGGTVSGAKISANTERPFTFADIRTTGANHTRGGHNHSTSFTPHPLIV